MKLSVRTVGINLQLKEQLENFAQENVKLLITENHEIFTK